MTKEEFLSNYYIEVEINNFEAGGVIISRVLERKTRNSVKGNLINGVKTFIQDDIESELEKAKSTISFSIIDLDYLKKAIISEQLKFILRNYSVNNIEYIEDESIFYE